MLQNYGWLKRNRRIIDKGVVLSFAIALLAWLALSFLLNREAVEESDARPCLMILDTDISSDVDDVGAVAVAHGLEKQGLVRILGMMVSSGDPWGIACLDAINTWFGRPDIPLGMVRGKSVKHESKYTKIIADEFPHIRSGAGVPDAVRLYRQILSEQPDSSVTVVTVGYLTNLRDLLLSKADEFSPLSGDLLVERKVKRLICMGGTYPSGREWNFYQDADATVFVFKNWHTPVVFTGFETGKGIGTGAGLQDAGQDNPVRRSYELYNNLQDRSSWDQVAVYYAAVTGKDRKTDLWSTVSGRNIIEPDGKNYWLNERVKDGWPDHSYIVQRGTNGEIEALLEQLMLTRPFSD